MMRRLIVKMFNNFTYFLTANLSSKAEDYKAFEFTNCFEPYLSLLKFI
jgi:hypothetical protein